ncbi:MAG: SdiA-regulated domain-containing protein [Bacteroidota bacterium]
MWNNLLPKKYLVLCSVSAMLITLLGLSCVEKGDKDAASPPGYNLAAPHKYNMPESLQEISGIAFNKGDQRLVYAHQDEDGNLFSLPLGTKDKTVTKFSGKGDYEDIAIAKNWIIILKSNGTLFSFPLSEAKNEVATGVIETKDLLPKGEYEGMFANEVTGQVYVLCKTCKQDKGSKITSGYILALQQNGTLKYTGSFKIDMSALDKLTGKKKGPFHPSGLAINPLTQEWYIISSVNKVLVVANAQWKIKNAYHLSANTFNQPEGIAFDKSGNLFISNEGSETEFGNILRFDYKKP